MAVVAAVKRWWKTAGALVVAVVLLNVWGEVISLGCPKVLLELFGAEGEEIMKYRNINFVTTKPE